MTTTRPKLYWIEIFWRIFCSGYAIENARIVIEKSKNLKKRNL